MQKDSQTSLRFRRTAAPRGGQRKAQSPAVVPRLSTQQLKRDCERAFVLVSSKRAELLAAIERGRSGLEGEAELKFLHAELENLTALWLATCDALVHGEMVDSPRRQ